AASFRPRRRRPVDLFLAMTIETSPCQCSISGLDGGPSASAAPPVEADTMSVVPSIKLVAPAKGTPAQVTPPTKGVDQPALSAEGQSGVIWLPTARRYTTY